jgi:hypothetical protein
MPDPLPTPIEVPGPVQDVHSVSGKAVDLDELMGQVVKAARDRQEVLTLQVPVGKKLQHPFHGF